MENRYSVRYLYGVSRSPDIALRGKIWFVICLQRLWAEVAKGCHAKARRL